MTSPNDKNRLARLHSGHLDIHLSTTVLSRLSCEMHSRDQHINDQPAHKQMQLLSFTSAATQLSPVHSQGSDVDSHHPP